MKRGGILLLLVVLMSIPTVLADSQEWMITNAKSDLKSMATDELALVMLASSNQPADFKIFQDELELRRDESGCYPKGGCTVLDTAAVVYALHEIQDEDLDALAWLDLARKRSPVPGDWLLQIESDEQTVCTLSDDNKALNFTILDDKTVIECDDYFVNLGSCGGFSFPTDPVKVECDNNRVTLSLLRNVDNEYYFVNQLDNRPETTLTATDFCYGRTQSGADCHADSTAWTLLALDGTEHTTFSNPFLDSQASTPLHYYALQTIKKDAETLDRLVETLNEAGSYKGDGFQTAIAYLSLTGSAKGDEAGLAKDWLTTNLRDTGINQDTKQTAAALYALNPSILIPTGPVCGDNIVNRAIEECDGTSDALCPDSCGSPGTLNACTCVDTSATTVFVRTTTTTLEDDGELAECEIGDEIFSDCSCGSREIDEGYCCLADDGDSYSSDEMCEEPGSGGGFIKILVGLVIFILGAGIIYYLIKKKGITAKGLLKKKPKPRPTRNMKMPPRTPQPQFRQAFQPGQRPQTSGRTPDQEVEDQLDKSIAEAKKLLKRND